jgi:hypothetical protein
LVLVPSVPLLLLPLLFSFPHLLLSDASKRLSVCLSVISYDTPLTPPDFLWSTRMPRCGRSIGLETLKEEKAESSRLLRIYMIVRIRNRDV